MDIDGSYSVPRSTSQYMIILLLETKLQKGLRHKLHIYSEFKRDAYTITKLTK